MSWQTGGALAASMATYVYNQIKYTTAMNYAYANLYWGDMDILHKKCHVYAEIQTELRLKQIRTTEDEVLSKGK